MNGSLDSDIVLCVFVIGPAHAFGGSWMTPFGTAAWCLLFHALFPPLAYLRATAGREEEFMGRRVVTSRTFVLSLRRDSTASRLRLHGWRGRRRHRRR